MRGCKTIPFYRRFGAHGDCFLCRTVGNLDPAAVSELF